MTELGSTIRLLREQSELPLRKVAAFLDVDQAILSKIERGQRKASREQVIRLAEYFDVEQETLLVAWLSDRLAHEAVTEPALGLRALYAAEEKVKYQISNTGR